MSAIVGGMLFLSVLFPLRQESAGIEPRHQELQHEVVVQLKLIQVYVVDRDGNPVADMTQDDFELYENGRLQKITDFEKHLLAPFVKKEDRPGEVAAEKPIPVTDKIPPKLTRKFFILLDFFQIDLVGFNQSKKAALHFIVSQLQSTDEVAVLSYSSVGHLIFHQYLTTDHQRAKETLMRLRRAPERNVESLPQGAKPVRSSMLDGERRFEGGGGSGDSEKNKIRSFLTDMNEMAKSLRMIPGYKHLIYFSGGITRNWLYDEGAAPDVTTMPQADPGIRVRYEEMSKEFGAAGVSVYAVNADGTRAYFEEETNRGDHALKMIADLSGGKYFEDVMKYEKISLEINAVTGNYYVLGFYPDLRMDGKYREIDVRIKRPGCRVMAQSGYFSPKPFTEFSDFEKQVHLFDLALNERPYFQEPFRFSAVAAAFSSDTQANLALISCVPGDFPKEVIVPRVEAIALMVDRKSNSLYTLRRALSSSQLYGKKSYIYAIVGLPAGEYDCRIVLRNIESGRGAVGSASVVLSDPPKTGVKLYRPLFLIPGEKANYLELEAKKDEAGEVGKDSLRQIYPYLSNDLSFLLGEIEQGTASLLAVLRYSVFELQDPRIRLRASLASVGDQREIAIPLRLLNRAKQEEQAEVCLVEFKFDDLQAGSYALKLVAEDEKSHLKSEVTLDFKIK